MDYKKQIESALRRIAVEMGVSDVEIIVSQPELSHGDYTTNIAMVLASKLGSNFAKASTDKQNPMEIAEKIASDSAWDMARSTWLEKIEVVNPGFINFWLKQEVLVSSLLDKSGKSSSQGDPLQEKRDKQTKGQSVSSLKGKRYLVEYAHPNTHKEMHIGHMRTLITGEAVSRLLSANGASVFRANYQGDIGLHVAKALYGIQKIMGEKGLTLDKVDGWSNTDKAHFLGEGYVKGNQIYNEFKKEIDESNTFLYKRLLNEDTAEISFRTEEQVKLWNLYEETRQWSLDYYEDFYKRFYTKFDRLFFESEMVEPGKKIVLENVGKVFKEDNEAIIFEGEEYGFHTRVFITKAGNPTYEGKEMGNGFAEYQAFPFDMKIHVVGSEQAGYFQVVFKALELLDPAKFEGKQHHISMGMVNLIGMKMSSRTGEILRVDDLIDKVKDRIRGMAEEGRIQSEDIEAVTEMVSVGAIKYSVLKVGTGQNVAFDIEKSVSLEGNSGPYLQYTYARTQSVLHKSGNDSGQARMTSFWGANATPESRTLAFEIEESDLLRLLYRFPEIVEQAGIQYGPNVLCGYLYDLAKLYNLFYQKHKIIGSEKEEARLSLTKATGDVLKVGLKLLGIEAPERM